MEPAPKINPADVLRTIRLLNRQFKNLETYIDNPLESKTYYDIQVRREDLIEYHKELNTASNILDDADDATFEALEVCQRIYYTVSAKYEQAIASYQAAEQHDRSNSAQVNQSQCSKIKLPQIQLQTFDGKYNDWKAFKDLFESCIDKNKELSDVQRFYYLRSALKGEPLQLIQSLNITNENYRIAFKTLTERYENKHILVNNHLKNIFDQPKISGSASSIRKLCNDIIQNLSLLKNLELPVESWDAIIVYIITNNLDNMSKKDWELHRPKSSNSLPKLAELLSYLEQRAQAFELLDGHRQEHVPYYKKATTMSTITSDEIQHHDDNNQSINVYQMSKPYCKLCQGQHRIFHCDKFLNMSVQDRIKYIRDNKRCNNCLKYNCNIDQCTSSACRRCGKRHNTLLHTNIVINIDEVVNDNQIADNKVQSVPLEVLTCKEDTVIKTQVLLTTTLVKIKDVTGQDQVHRALLDSGSQTSIISTVAAHKLGLKVKSTDMTVTGINQHQSTISKSVYLNISSFHHAFNIQTEALLMDKITMEIPSTYLQWSKYQFPYNIKLADPTFNVPSKIDLLIGADIFFKSLIQEQIKITNHDIVLQNSLFGWLISGRFTLNKDIIEQKYLVNTCINDKLSEQLTRFWEIENVTTKYDITEEHKLCEADFKKNTTRDANGKYTVALPLRHDPSTLGNSYNKALRRFYNLERKFNTNEDIKKGYVDFMNEYIQLNHMTESPPLESHEGNCYYLSHHAVYKDTSTTTRVRVVFNASMPTSNQLSLNDILMIGPTVQQDLISIIFRFRLHNIVMTADVTKMDRQFLVAENQRDLQRILWRADPSEPLKEYKLNTITYGTASASFLATRCLQQISIDEGDKFCIMAKQAVMEDFYMDDILTGAQNVEEARILQQDISNLLKTGGLHLRKWCSNSKELLEQIDPNDRENTFLFADHTAVKTLGLYWQPHSDCFKFEVFFDMKESYTKRDIVTIVAKIFDPLGLISPVTTKAKIMLQDLWLDKIGWDEDISTNHYWHWIHFQQKLPLLNDVSIPRPVLQTGEGVIHELHGFSDSSERAYGAVLYIRSYDVSGNVHVQLLCSKSRLAPTKTITLPKLELCGALLLSRILHKFLICTQLVFDNICCWSDATITLSWIASAPSRLKVFVANRVTEIQELTKGFQWRHVNSIDNPADCVSRGFNADKLSDIWWHGPQWLRQPCLDSYGKFDIVESIPETKIVKQICVDSFDLLTKYSSWLKLLAVVAYLNRFVHNCRYRDMRETGQLNAVNIKHAMIQVCRLVQKQIFSKEYNKLLNKQPLNSKSKLLSLAPFIDQNKVMRVGGRLQNSTLSSDQKHPILLPRDHHITKIIARYVHITNYHVGPQSLLAIMRQQFWPIDGKGLARKTVHKCIKCFRVKPYSKIPIMGALPAARVEPCRAFIKTGVDFCGPINIRQSMNRRVVTVKAYIALFICMATKAVHLELVSSLSTDAFVGALRRFISRRGHILELHCDNATNFVGCKNLLTEFHNLLSQDNTISEINKGLFPNPIKFCFIPANSPHFGGLWERSVKTVKYHLRRVVGDALLVFEELSTLLCQIEACINSRPITALSEDPNDLSALTPAHFLVGDSIILPLEPDLTHISESRLKRWQRVQSIFQHFWKRWVRDYLSSLQVRNKWKVSNDNLKLNDLVLIKDDNLIPFLWPIARVINLHPGPDGDCRVATVKTNSSIFKRAVTKLFKLPLD